MRRRAEAIPLPLVGSPPDPADPLGWKRPLRAGDVRALRRRLGLTQDLFARLLAVTRSVVNEWERRPLTRKLLVRGANHRNIRALIYALNERGEELAEEIRACVEADAEENGESGVEGIRAFVAIFGTVIGQW